MSEKAKPTTRCDELNINYGETCSRKATYVYDSPRNDRPLYFCTQHAPKRNRYCKRLDKVSA